VNCTPSKSRQSVGSLNAALLGRTRTGAYGRTASDCSALACSSSIWLSSSSRIKVGIRTSTLSGLHDGHPRRQRPLRGKPLRATPYAPCSAASDRRLTPLPGTSTVVIAGRWIRRMDSATSRGMTQLSRRNAASPVSPVCTTLAYCSSSFIPDSSALSRE